MQKLRNSLLIFLLLCLCIIAGIHVLGIGATLVTPMVSSEVDKTFADIGKTLSAPPTQKEDVQKKKAERLAKAGKEIATIIKSNKHLIEKATIPDKYLKGKLIGVYIYKDGVFIGNMTLEQWMIYVLATNKDIKITWIDNIASVEPMYQYSDKQDQGIRFKLPGSQSSVILFQEEMGELYPSYYSAKGGALIDLSILPQIKTEAVDTLTILTNLSAYTE